MLRTISLTSVLLIFAAVGLAQNFRGGINGIVTDQFQYEGEFAAARPDIVSIHACGCSAISLRR